MRKAEQNINEDCSYVDLAINELEGCPESFVQSLPSAGECHVSLRFG